MGENILYCMGNRDITDETAVHRINESIGVESSYVVVAYDVDEKKYSNESGCILRNDCVVGSYSKYIDKLVGECKPLDDEVLLPLSKYFCEIMRIQQRFEEKREFQIPNTLDFHYQLLMSHIYFWNNFLDNNKITKVIFTNAPHEGYDNVIYYLCKLKNISKLIRPYSVLPKRTILVEEYETMDLQVKREYEKLKVIYDGVGNEDIPLSQDVLTFFNNMCSENKTDRKKAYVKGNTREEKFYIKYGEKRIYKIILDELYVQYAQYKNNFLKLIGKWISSVPDIYKHICYVRKIWNRTEKLVRDYERISEKPVSGEKYIYFSFHYLPEVTSAPLGGGIYSDQFIPISILCKCIPGDWKIYVKIHPSQIAQCCSIETFEQIKSLDNVRLISDEYSSQALVDEAQAVATLTGSVAWEAQFYNKPVLLFGYSEKNVAPLSYYVRTKDDCEKAIKDIQFGNKKTDFRELKIFTKALENVSFEDNREDFIEAVLKNTWG